MAGDLPEGMQALLEQYADACVDHGTDAISYAHHGKARDARESAVESLDFYGRACGVSEAMLYLGYRVNDHALRTNGDARRMASKMTQFLVSGKI